MFKKVIGQRTPQEPLHTMPALEETRRQEPAPASYGTATARPAPTPTRNALSTDVEIKGIVKFTNDLVVDGKIEGEIFSEGSLTVGEHARIKAEVKTATVIVYGKVHGNLTATDRVELKASAEVIGDIKAKTLSIEAGAIFVGKSTVGAPAQTAIATPAANPAPTPTATPAPVSASNKATPTPATPVQGTFASTRS